MTHDKIEFKKSFKATVKVDVNAQELGNMFACGSSEQQVEFLRGMVSEEGFYTWRELQCYNIADYAGTEEARKFGEALETLSAFLLAKAGVKPLK